MSAHVLQGAAPLLALDTSSDWCSAALLLPGVLDSVAERAGHAHSRRLLSMIDSLLVPHGLEVASLGAIAYGCGPGSFTGLRIACGVAQGLGFAHGTPLVPVGTLEAIAVTAMACELAPATVAVVCDARMGEAYVAVYEVESDARIEVTIGPRLAAPSVLPQVLADALSPGFVAAGEGWQRFGDELGALAARAGRLDPGAYSRADAVARIGARRAGAGAGVAAADAGLFYVRDKVALDVDEQRRLHAGRGAPAGGTAA